MKRSKSASNVLVVTYQIGDLIGSKHVKDTESITSLGVLNAVATSLAKQYAKDRMSYEMYKFFILQNAKIMYDTRLIPISTKTLTSYGIDKSKGIELVMISKVFDWTKDSKSVNTRDGGSTT